MGRVDWPVVVRLQHVEHASAEIAGAFSAHSITPLPLPPAASRWLATFCANTRDRVVALTFDDGPHPVHTPQILDLLKARKATATFFVLADQVDRHPEIARRIAADGHEVGLHGADHRSLRSMSASRAAAAVRSARDRVSSVVGRRPVLYRPPYGEYTPAQIVRLRLLGLETVIWSGDSRDWASDDGAEITARAARAVIPGGIVLMHDNRADPETAAPGAPLTDYDRTSAVGDLLDHLERTGFRSLTVSELLRGRQRVRSIARYGADGLHVMGAP